MKNRNKTARSLIFLLLVLAAWPGAPLSGADDVLWRELDPEYTVFMELQHGTVVIELNPVFAPKTVKRFRKLTEDRFYDGLSFYRVIDGFVAQGGDGSDMGEISRMPQIEAEFEIDWSDDLPFTSVQKNDLFAPETGFIDGFAAARDMKKGTAWLTHCPGVVAMARGDDPNSSRTDFYIVIGQAPRYLDRNLNIFGRVVVGMDVVQRINRGPAPNNGIIEDETATSRIRRMQLASDIPEDSRMYTYVMDTNSDGFEDLLKGRRNRKQAFFHNRPPKVLDICQVPMAGRITK
jgi:peptidylprolyl isomerase